MRKHLIFYLLIGASIRYYLATSQHGTTIGNRVEISTPLNAFKRLREGVYLYQQEIDPYKGDVVHEMPMILLALVGVFEAAFKLVPLLYVLMDMLTALLLYLLSREFVRSKLKQQKVESDNYAAETEELQLQESDFDKISNYVLMAYLFNPLSILNCAGLTSTIFSNFLLAFTLYCMMKRHLLPCLLFLAMETMRNLYPIVLVAPVILTFANKSVAKAIGIVILFLGLCGSIVSVNYSIMKDWSFLDSTLGFIFFYRDLQPNIGLFWYFFTEMFEHFRTMFLITFQMNATVLYLIPLSLKLRKEPLLLATVLIALMSIFRSYPCLGDVSFYLALLPLWRRCWKFMAHNFVVFCFFMVTLTMMPALWHLWIYAGSANANFYFGTTLAFSTGQIFLVTDLLFAYVKREFCLRNGQKIYIDGKEAKIILE